MSSEIAQMAFFGLTAALAVAGALSASLVRHSAHSCYALITAAVGAAGASGVLLGAPLSALAMLVTAAGVALAGLALTPMLLHAGELRPNVCSAAGEAAATGDGPRSTSARAAIAGTAIAVLFAALASIAAGAFTGAMAPAVDAAAQQPAAVATALTLMGPHLTAAVTSAFALLAAVVAILAITGANRREST